MDDEFTSEMGADLPGDTPTPKADDEDDLIEEGEDTDPDDQEDPVDGLDDEDPKDDQEDEDEDEDEEDPEPEPFDEDTSLKQSKDKKTPANKAFAALNRDNKVLKIANKEVKAELDYVDSQFAEIANKAGFKGITSARDFVDQMIEQDTLKKYDKTKDPSLLVDVAEQRMNRKASPGTQGKPLDKAQVNLEMKGQIDAFNLEYESELKDIDGIMLLPNADKIIDRMGKGDTLSEAHLVVNKDAIMKDNKSSARQKATNKAKGFGHVKRNAKAESLNSNRVTAKEMDESIDLWSTLFPGQTKSQYRKMLQEEKDLDS